MFDLFWVPNFIKIGHIAILRTNLPKFLISGHNPQFQISHLWLTNLTWSDCQISKHRECISFLGPNFPGMSGLILVLVSNVCYLAVILIFLVGTWWLLLVTARYRSLLLVPTFSMNADCALSNTHQLLMVVITTWWNIRFIKLLVVLFSLKSRILMLKSPIKIIYLLELSRF